MATREIKTRLVVDGEQAYNRAIEDAKKSITQMGSALSLATAQFKQDGDAMKLMETRSKTLRAEIDQQNVIVKSLEGTLKDVTKRYGEDSREAEKWQTELNRAQTKLVNLQNELANNEKGLDRNGKAFESASGKAQGFGNELSSLDRIQQSTTFQALNTALGNIERGFKTALSKGKEFGEYIWNMAVDSSDRYDELATEAIKLNVPVQTLRAWDTAAKKIDTDVSDISKSLVKLVNPSDQVSNALQNLGVSTTKFTGEYGKYGAVVAQRDSIDIFWDTIEAIGKLGTVQEQETESNKIFGKSFQDLLPLIRAGRAAWEEEVGKALETAPDEEAANRLTTFNDALVDFKRVLTDFQDTISQGIAPGLTDLTKAGTDFLTEMTKWAQSPEGQEKLDKLSQAISDMVSSLATEENFNAVIEAATGVVEGFTEALGWVITHKGEVETGLLTIAGGFAAIKLGSGLLTALTLFKEIKWLNMATGAKGLSSAFAAAPNGGWFTLLSKLMLLAPWVAGAAVLLTPSGGDAQWDTLYDENGARTKAGEAAGLPETHAEYDSWTAEQKTAHDNATRIAAEQEKLEAAIAKYLAFLNGRDYSWYSDAELRGELLGGIPWAGSSEAAVERDQEAFEAILDDLKARIESGEALPPSMDAAAILREYLGGSEPDFSRTAEDIYDDLYKAINDYDPGSNPLDKYEFFDNVLSPLVRDLAGMEGVTGGAAEEIVGIMRKKFMDSFEDDWEGSTGGLLNILQEAIDENAQGVKLTLDPIIPDNAEELLQSQVGRITLQVATVPVVGGGVYSSGANASRSYTSNSNLYVQNMNMNGSADVNGLADAIAARTRQDMAGLGG